MGQMYGVEHTMQDKPVCMVSLGTQCHYSRSAVSTPLPSMLSYVYFDDLTQEAKQLKVYSSS